MFLNSNKLQLAVVHEKLLAQQLLVCSKRAACTFTLSACDSLPLYMLLNGLKRKTNLSILYFYAQRPQLRGATTLRARSAGRRTLLTWRSGLGSSSSTSRTTATANRDARSTRPRRPYWAIPTLTLTYAQWFCADAQTCLGSLFTHAEKTCIYSTWLFYP
jgi:hypothetical protein